MGNGITRAGVATAKATGDLSLDAIRGALAACDPDRAAEIALARLAGGEPLPIEVVLDLVPQLLDVPVASGLMGLAARTPESPPLTAMLGRFPVFADGVAVRVVVAWAAWRAQTPRDLMIREVRRLARLKLEKSDRALVVALVDALDDAHLRALAEPLGRPKAADLKAVVAEADKLLATPIAQLVAELPAQAEAAASIGFTVRTGPRVGRNDPCPCGSGQKYKKCHADEDAAVTASPVVGMSWESFLGDGAVKMTVADVEALSMFDLARVELAKLPDVALVRAFDRFLVELAWARAIAVADELVAREHARADLARDEIVLATIERGQLELAEAQLAHLIDPISVTLRRLELDLRAHVTVGAETIVGLAERAVRGELDDYELAQALLAGAPGLGILVARGCVRKENAADAEVICELIERARDQLMIAPDDPAWDMIPKADPKAPRAAATDKKARVVLEGTLRETGAKIAQLEHDLAEARADRDRDRAAASAPLDPEKLRVLKRRIDELEGLVREGVVERTELRRQLGMVAPVAVAPIAIAKPEDDDDGDELDDIARDIAIPTFSRRTLDALEDVPRAVAAETMRTIGALAAGDVAAWRRAKLARDMARQVLMARVGIHHRLLFRTEDGGLEIMDLVTREELTTTLKRLRSTRA